MRHPEPNEEYVTVIDNKGREHIQRVEYVVADILNEVVYVTVNGLTYAKDSLTRKAQSYLIDEFKRIPDVLANPDILIADPTSEEDTQIYYKRLYIPAIRTHLLVAVVVKFRQGAKFLYNFHVQQSGKVKGHHAVIAPKVRYLAPGHKRRDFGL